MADQGKSKSVQEKIREALEKLGEALDDWLAGARPQPQPIPVPVDRRPYGRRRNY
ncbi:MAG: hypothetical protein KDJ65_14260 [Anaerolineae bacterium]|nr:hypothetical protein [Anaerolineae bacterium]MCB0213004.1 hypothetical protein [Anaerolineae bacterium]